LSGTDAITLDEISIETVKTLFTKKQDAVLIVGMKGDTLSDQVTAVLKNVIYDQKVDNITYYLDVRPDGTPEGDLRNSDNQDFEYFNSKIARVLDHAEETPVPMIIYIRGGLVKGAHIGALEGYDATKTLTQEQICDLTFTIIDELARAGLTKC
jgi:hypothetical protein